MRERARLLVNTPLAGRALEESGSALLRMGELWAAHQEAVDECLVRPFTSLVHTDIRQATVCPALV